MRRVYGALMHGFLFSLSSTYLHLFIYLSGLHAFKTHDENAQILIAENYRSRAIDKA